jgi:hypothetical protein
MQHDERLDINDNRILQSRLPSLIIAKNLSENSGTSFSLAMKYLLLLTINFTFVFCLNSSNFIRGHSLISSNGALKKMAGAAGFFSLGKFMETHEKWMSFILRESGLAGFSLQHLSLVNLDWSWDRLFRFFGRVN